MVEETLGEAQWDRNDPKLGGLVHAVGDVDPSVVPGQAVEGDLRDDDFAHAVEAIVGSFDETGEFPAPLALKGQARKMVLPSSVARSANDGAPGSVVNSTVAAIDRWADSMKSGYGGNGE